MKQAYTNHGSGPVYIGSVLLKPGETREVDPACIPVDEAALREARALRLQELHDQLQDVQVRSAATQEELNRTLEACEKLPADEALQAEAAALAAHHKALAQSIHEIEASIDLLKDPVEPESKVKTTKGKKGGA